MTDPVSGSPEGTKADNQDAQQQVSEKDQQNVELTMEQLEHILPNKHLRESFLRLINQLDMDLAARTTIKGHLFARLPNGPLI
jgi:hypothetical protein